MEYLIICLVVLLYVFVMWRLLKIDYVRLKLVKFFLVLILSPPLYLMFNVLIGVYVFRRNNIPEPNMGQLAVASLLLYSFWLFNFMIERFRKGSLKVKPNKEILGTLEGFQLTTISVFRYIVFAVFVFFQCVYIIKFVRSF